MDGHMITPNGNQYDDVYDMHQTFHSNIKYILTSFLDFINDI